MAGQKVVFTSTEYRILASLAHSVGQIVPQEQLLEHAWGTAYVDEDHLLQVKINRLRRKLVSDPAHSRYILTEPGVGYVLATPPQV
jgi:two-component system, OmpR family, KDP operon response regulator KdpE